MLARPAWEQATKKAVILGYNNKLRKRIDWFERNHSDVSKILTTYIYMFTQVWHLIRLRFGAGILMQCSPPYLIIPGNMVFETPHRTVVIPLTFGGTNAHFSNNPHNLLTRPRCSNAYHPGSELQYYSCFNDTNQHLLFNKVLGTRFSLRKSVAFSETPRGKISGITSTMYFCISLSYVWCATCKRNVHTVRAHPPTVVCGKFCAFLHKLQRNC